MGNIAVNVVWFKRDLRLSDHAALRAAAGEGRPILFLFCLEPTLMTQADAADRHWRFAWQAAVDLKQQLAAKGHVLHIAHHDMPEALEVLRAEMTIQSLFSTQETGNKASFDRDRAVRHWCRRHGVRWRQFGQDGVVRGRKHRHGWADQLENYLRQPLETTDLQSFTSLDLPAEVRSKLSGPSLPRSITQSVSAQQPGGSSYGRRYWGSFLEGRGIDYGRHLSKPALSRRSCSRLSPYLAWGNLSVRELWQACEEHADGGRMGWALNNFKERLFWRSHYLQKLEAEWEMEFEPINRGFVDLGRVFDEARFQAWTAGQTGFPMVDASMRCLEATGWINFRMRAMLATFATFTLWLPYRAVALHLARLFLDYEPGIHYPQLQMQAGLTGYHTLRIYNPTIQAERHDADGAFIHQWLPELRTVPAPQCHRPWAMTRLEQQLYHCRIGEDYPLPMVNFDTETAAGRDRYWRHRALPAVQERLPGVWERHCLPNSIARYRRDHQQARAAGSNDPSG